MRSTLSGDDEIAGLLGGLREDDHLARRLEVLHLEDEHQLALARELLADLLDDARDGDDPAVRDLDE